MECVEEGMGWGRSKEGFWKGGGVLGEILKDR